VKTWQPRRGEVLLANPIKTVLKANLEVVVIGTGTAGSLRLHPKAEKRLQQAGVEVLAHRTQKARETYWQRRSHRSLAVLLHITS
jgi:hypothetical protein